jgi:hypothetical protein
MIVIISEVVIPIPFPLGKGKEVEAVADRLGLFFFF